MISLVMWFFIIDMFYVCPTVKPIHVFNWVPCAPLDLASSVFFSPSCFMFSSPEKCMFLFSVLFLSFTLHSISTTPSFFFLPFTWSSLASVLGMIGGKDSSSLGSLVTKRQKMHGLTGMRCQQNCELFLLLIGAVATRARGPFCTCSSSMACEWS